MTRKILAVFNDTHANHRLGLCNPLTRLQKEDENGDMEDWYPALGPVQEYLWRLYGYCIEALKKIAGDAPIIAIHNGDECQGWKHPADHVSSVGSDEIIISAWNFKPILALPNLVKLRLAHGTGAHNWQFGTSTAIVTELLNANYPGKDIKCVHHGLLDIDGYTVDYAHHGPFPGSREWLRGNVARFYLRDVMTREIKKKRKPADVYLRAHYHQDVHEILEDGAFTSEIYLVPSFCGLDEHAQQATRSADTMTFGMLVLEIENGKKVAEHRLYDKIDIRTKEKA